MSYEVQDFDKQVIERSKQVPVVVDFWAPWCGPCRTLGPVLERLAEQAGGRWELVKVNTEEQQDLAGAFNIASIPAVKLFVNGQVAHEFVGAIPEKAIRAFLDKALPSKGAARLGEAERLLSEGDYSKARDILASIVADEPGNIEARVLLAQALLSLAPEGVAEILRPVAPDSESAEKAEALKTLARIAQLPQAQAGLAPAPVRERYLTGAAAVRAADFGTALQAFIEVLQRDKAYDDGGAKKACKAIFTLLGMRHPLVERFFRPFTSTLYS